MDSSSYSLKKFWFTFFRVDKVHFCVDAFDYLPFTYIL